MPAGDAPEPGLPLLTVSYTLVVMLALGVAVYASFLVPAGPRVGGVLLSYGIALAVVGNAAVALAGLGLTGTRLGALAPAPVWLVVTVLVLGGSGPGGDAVLRARARDYLLILLGALTPVVVAVLGRPWRGMAALGARPPDRGGR